MKKSGVGKARMRGEKGKGGVEEREKGYRRRK